ncbi:unnamed protein product [Rotaria sp. Silwood2]|nr:unnamed protein product [Rotaria sp. Silwood2]CAF2906971.1 unnamed protein product [Rotaria sp. Silwood2]CAF3992413.1 unnamed protein product [Rotaria sp. Silwood2]CAF4023755.1 unnamed protein product [Rotaria sp. Silwood2]
MTLLFIISLLTTFVNASSSQKRIDGIRHIKVDIVVQSKNYELLDVPGFDSPIKEHRDAGLQAIKTADAFLFLTNGQQPSLTQPQIRLLQEIQENHFEAMQRAFGIITKLDLCQTPATYEDHYDKAFNELIEKKFKPEHIYVACPRLQILDKNTEEFRIINRKIHSFSNDLAQGFE